MNQDANRIIDIINEEWANEVAQCRKKIAILTEENERMRLLVEAIEEKDAG